MRFLWLMGISLIMLLLVQASLRPQASSLRKKEKLSEYGFFTGQLKNLTPSNGVVPYDLNTPLFSNYAEKLRFIKLPEGTAAAYNDTSVFDFPVGTVFIKNFYYPNDFRKPEKGRRILETRLLVHEAGGWSAWPYIWNEEQTEAFYDPAGETVEVAYVDKAGKRVRTPYVIPNSNQCKGCHIKQHEMVPIGPAARHLNRDFTYPSGETENQLKHWKVNGMLQDLPAAGQPVPALAVWDDPSTGDVSSRARAYLDINCGHCHSQQGPANTSGLFLDIYEKNMSRLGVNKSPVAAGRGSGAFQVDIAPGDPAHSILVFRMKTTDPGIAMPEIGREQVHKEGVELIERWIRDMPSTTEQE